MSVHWRMAITSRRRKTLDRHYGEPKILTHQIHGKRSKNILAKHNFQRCRLANNYYLIKLSLETYAVKEIKEAKI